MSDFLSNPKTLKTTNNFNSTINEPQKDRISSLPDPLLVDILTLIPLKSAVATSTLSRRWRHLWTHIPHLIFDNQENHPWRRRNSAIDDVEERDLLREFNTILDHIIQQLNSPNIKTFHIDIPCPSNGMCMDDINDCSKRFATWIPLIYARNVVNFKVISNTYTLYGFPRIVLPSLVFESESLVELTLSGGIHIKYPKSGININLPMLKKLDLDGIEFDSDKGLQLLLNSCPLLESLCLLLYLYKNDVLEISGKNLKSLIIRRKILGCKLVIDAPLLEEFSFEGFLCSCNFVNYSSRLIKAKLDFWNLHENKIEVLRNIEPILNGISNAMYLHLNNGLRLFNALYYLDIVDEIGSMFINFTHLRINMILDKWAIDCHDWVEESPIPECLISKLKKIELFHIDGYDEEMIMELLGYILSKGDLLEMLYVSSISSRCGSDNDDYVCQNRWECEVSRQLFALPRSNPSCKIEFVGEYIRASTDNTGDHLIVKQDVENPTSIGCTI